MTAVEKAPTRRWKRHKNGEPLALDWEHVRDLFELAIETEDRTDEEQAAVEAAACWLDEHGEDPRPTGAFMALTNAIDNAELIQELAALGYLRSDHRILDPTWGRGRFWTRWQPDEGNLVGSDLDATKSPTGTSVDVLDLPHEERSFDVAVLDLGYKLNGTSQDPKRPGQDPDADYGVKESATRDERVSLQLRAVEALAPLLVDEGLLLVKTQSMVNGGKMRWQADDITRHAERLGFRKLDTAIFESYRPQPEGRGQKHLRQNYSVLLVFRLEDRHRPLRRQTAVFHALRDGLAAGARSGEIDLAELAVAALAVADGS